MMYSEDHTYVVNLSIPVITRTATRTSSVLPTIPSTPPQNRPRPPRSTYIPVSQATPPTYAIGMKFSVVVLNPMVPGSATIWRSNTNHAPRAMLTRTHERTGTVPKPATLRDGMVIDEIPQLSLRFLAWEFLLRADHQNVVSSGKLSRCAPH